MHTHKMATIYLLFIVVMVLNHLVKQDSMHASPEVNAIDFKYTCMTVPRLTQNKHTFKCSRV